METMEHGEIRVVISTDLQDYEHLFDFEWAKSFCHTAGNTSIFEESQALLLAWRAVGNTFRLPWMMMSSFASFVHGWTNAHSPTIRELIPKLVDGIVEEMDDKLNENKKKQLQRAINRIAARMPPQFEAKVEWDEIRSSGSSTCKHRKCDFACGAASKSASLPCTSPTSHSFWNA